MGFSVQQECPQCGGPIDLDEADRLLRCPYCGVSSYLANNAPPSFVLPSRTPEATPLYVPYIRFKGAVYTCQGLEVKHRMLDVTHLGTPHPLFPVSLGFRTQTLKLRHANPVMAGNFLPNKLSLDDALSRIMGSMPNSRQEPVFHMAHIGESFSFIYLPTAKRGDELVDLVTDAVLGTIKDQNDLLHNVPEWRPDWRPAFLATLCPACGWNLSGEKDSVVLFCRNCESAWEPTDTGFRPLPFQMVFAANPREDFVLLPFWRITAEAEGLLTMADFIRLTNQPIAIQPDWENRELAWISPAFKIRPKVYLRLAAQTTLGQPAITSQAKVLPSIPHPVNLPKTEALESLKIILAATALAKKNLMPSLTDLHFQTKDISLLLLPFRKNAHGVYQENLQINIDKNVLKLGRSL